MSNCTSVECEKMGPKKSGLSRKSQKSKTMSQLRLSESDDVREERLSQLRTRRSEREA